ncbi:MAG TPA: hypothetical protein PLR99_16255, partial [Polyangiaceae bacterium]|nr:hypothetical protein [Polyangiaceae bacterium]
MKLPPTHLRSFALALALAPLLGAACAPTTTPPPEAPRAQRPSPAASASAPVVAAVPKAPAPPPKITTPMAGEPSPTALGEARLLTSSCDDFAERRKASVEAELRRMHEELDASLQGWRDEQPECWAESRRRAAELRAQPLRGGHRGGLSALRASGILGSMGAALQGAGAGTGAGA